MTANDLCSGIGRKRTFEAVIAADYAQYGVTNGAMSATPGELLTCGIICDEWPSWALGLKIRGWNIRYILVHKLTWEKELRAWFPTAVIRLIGDSAWEAGDQMSALAWFSDLDPPRKLKLWVSTTKLVITRRRVRHLPQGGWRMTNLLIRHADCGGVTDGAWQFFIYQSSASDSSLPLLTRASAAQRDLNSILDTMLSGTPCLAPPPIASHVTPKVVLIRPNTYHSTGLLPWNARSSFVITRSVFSPTQWVRRKLNSSEVFKLLDFPEDFSGELSSAQRATIAQDTKQLPLKTILRVLDVLPEGLLSSGAKRLKHDHESNTNESTPKAAIATPEISLLDPGSSPSEFCAPDALPQPLLPSEATEADRNKKATKSDDAAVPEYLWDRQIVGDNDPDRPIKILALGTLRKFFLLLWQRSIKREFFAWFKLEHASNLWSTAARRDLDAGLECIQRSWGCTWWEWSAGSRPYFWRWNPEYRTQIRDGLPLWLRGPLPIWRVPQRSEPDPFIRAKVTAKLVKVRKFLYICAGLVKSLTSYFSVPKGEDDIRMVYDGTKCGLNQVLWSPWFPLPTIQMHLRGVNPGTFMGDIDIGDMFLNFILHERIRPHAGVDLTPYFPEELNEEQRATLWEHWCRCAMGLTSSPYQAVQAVLHAEERIRGNPSDPLNIFRWDDIKLNLPGSPDYDPSAPWVCKIRFGDGLLACDLIIYVDDVRTMGNTFEECRQASRRAASILNFLGLQDAARKRRDPSQTPGAWSGSIVLSDQAKVDLVVAQERWVKAQNMIKWIQEEMKAGDTIEFKPLERYRGYLIYLCRTYDAINPYLKGIHLSLDSWRPWRKDDGWKMTMSEIRAAIEEKGEDVPHQGQGKAPKRVKYVPRLVDDIAALAELFGSAEPPRRQFRPSATAVAVYSFGDASGSGFGSSLIIDGVIYYRHGQWNNRHAAESSNFRELANLIYAIEDANEKGFLQNAELFLFTDNTSAESAFYKGTSSSRKLFDLVLRLRKLQMNGGVVMHVIHVAGKRMIAQGTDSLSRGITTDGIMRGQKFTSFVPLHLSALDRQGNSLKEWVHSWFPSSAKWLEPKDWYYQGHFEETAIWTPPPAAADAALEQLGQAIHKRPQHTHLVIIPRLMTARWRKLLGKICDLVFTVPLGTEGWSNTQFEPLIVGIYFPLTRHEPWRLRGTPIVEHVEGLLRELPPSANRWGGIVLRELLQQTRKLDAMSPGMVRPLLRRN